MKLNELKNNPGARKSSRRVGRGVGSGVGKTCGRGQKGQKSRSGVSLNGYEGGQNPIHMRLPKRGFNNIFQQEILSLNVGRLQEALDKGVLDASKPVTLASLKDAGLARRTTQGVKLLGQGELKTAVTVEVLRASASAQEAIRQAKGTLKLLEESLAAA